MNRNRHLRLVEGEHVKLWLVSEYGTFSPEWVEGRVTRSGNIRIEDSSSELWLRNGSLLRLDQDHRVAGFTVQQVVDVLTERFNTEYRRDMKKLEVAHRQRIDRLSRVACEAE